MNNRCIVSEEQIDESVIKHYKFPDLKPLDVMHKWQLKAGNILLARGQIESKESPCVITFVLLNLQTETMETLHQIIAAPQTPLKGSLFLKHLLPESSMLSEIKDEIVTLSEEEKFIYRAICLDVNVTTSDVIPYTGNHMFPSSRFHMAIKMYLSYIKFRSIKLADNVYGILNNSSIDIYEQTCDELNRWTIKKLYSCLTKFPIQSGGNCYPLECNSFIATSGYDYYKVTFKLTQNNIEQNGIDLNFEKYDLNKMDGCPQLMNNSLFYLKQSENLYTIQQLNTMTGSSHPISVPHSRVANIYKNFEVLNNRYLLCRLWFCEITPSHTWNDYFIFDIAKSTYQYVKAFRDENSGSLELLSNYCFVTTDENKNAVSIIKFPQIDDWLTQINAILNIALENKLIDPLIKIIKDYLDNDIPNPHNFFNKKPDSLPIIPISEEAKQVSFCRCTIS